jgi:hypoxanthine-guanine phosphoribosyltransferase
VLDGVTFVITAGGEGLIRTWRFDAAKAAFEQIMVLEGHIRAVTCVLLNGANFCSLFVSVLNININIFFMIVTSYMNVN